MDISYKTRRLSYDLKLTGKYNLIVGDSGSGKSLLANFASALQKINGRSIGNKIPIYGDQNHIMRYINEVHKSIIVLDEDFTCSDFDELKSLMEVSDNWYILCFRENLGKFPFGVNNIFKLVGNARHKKMVPYFTGNEFTRVISNYSGIITEDSKSAYYAIKTLLSDRTITSAGGKGNISKYISNLPKHQVVILDLCGVGCNIFEILESSYTRESFIFSSKSFEHEVLWKVFGLDNVEFTEECWFFYKSEEEYYTSLLSDRIKQLLGVGYSKGDYSLIQLLVTGQGFYKGSSYNLIRLNLTLSELYVELLSSPGSSGMKRLVLQ